MKETHILYPLSSYSPFIAPNVWQQSSSSSHHSHLPANLVRGSTPTRAEAQIVVAAGLNRKSFLRIADLMEWSSVKVCCWASCRLKGGEGKGGLLFGAIDTLQIEWASCLGFVAKVLNAPGNQIHLRRERGIKWDGGGKKRSEQKSVKGKERTKDPEESLRLFLALASALRCLCLIWDYSNLQHASGCLESTKASFLRDHLIVPSPPSL